MKPRANFLALSILLAAPVLPAKSQTHKPPKEKKLAPRTVWNFDGGALLERDATAPGGAGFRLSGRLTAPQFFGGLKRIDDEQGTQYRRETEVVTEFPDQVILSFVIRDFPCASQLQETGERTYLTQALIASMRLSLYWKRGIDLRPVEKVSDQHFSVKRVAPFAVAPPPRPPDRLQWFS